MTYADKLTLYLASPSKRRAERVKKGADQFRHYVERFIKEAGITNETGETLVMRLTTWLNEQNYSSRTLAWVRGMLTQFFLWAYGFTENDVARVPRTPIQGETTYSGYTLNADEVGQILTFILQRPLMWRGAAEQTALRNAAGICVLACTGIRIAQLTNIAWDTVRYHGDGASMTIEVMRQKNVEQTIKPIEFPVNKTFGSVEVEPILADYIAYRSAQNYGNYLFCNEQGGKLSEEYWRKLLRFVSHKTGIERCNPHAFRALVATSVAEKHGVLAAAQVLDHTSTATTMRYIQEQKSLLGYLS